MVNPAMKSTLAIIALVLYSWSWLDEDGKFPAVFSPQPLTSELYQSDGSVPIL